MSPCCNQLKNATAIYGPAMDRPFQRSVWQIHYCFYADDEGLDYCDDNSPDRVEPDDEYLLSITFCPFCGSKLPLPEKYWIVTQNSYDAGSENLTLNVLPESKIQSCHTKIKQVDLTDEQLNLMKRPGYRQ